MQPAIKIHASHEFNFFHLTECFVLFERHSTGYIEQNKFIAIYGTNVIQKTETYVKYNCGFMCSVFIRREEVY